MGLVINTNQSSLMIQRNLAKATAEMSTYMERLSTGLRINNATDDAAGLALSEKLKTQINSSDIAKNNVQTGINLVQVGESDLGTVHENLQRMRDLAVQSANGVYSADERAALDNEFQQRLTEIDRIFSSSEFSGTMLFDSTTPAAIEIQAGANNTTEDRIDLNEDTIFEDMVGNLSTVGGDITDVTNARAAIDSLDTDITDISAKRSYAGAMINRLASTIERIDVKKENMSSAFSVIRDADIAVEAANLTRVQILQQSAASLLQQANQSQGIALSLL